MSADDLTKLRVGLAVVFAFTILGLVAELCYVLWRRRTFQRQNLDGEASDITSNCTFSTDYHQNPPSKELLYFFCWKSRQSRIEPADGIPVFQCSGTAPPQDEVTEPADDLLKLQEILYGPSRMLFTIKEEDPKEAESGTDVYSAERSSSSLENNNKKRVCLEECFDDEANQEQEQDEDEDGSVMVVIEDDEDLETPFSTPCGSPPYYTPTPSPSRDQKLSHTVQIDGTENHFDDDDGH